MTQARIETKIASYLTKIESGSKLSKAECDEYLRELARYECWNSFNKLIQTIIFEPGSKQERLYYYIWLASVQYSHLDDIQSCIITCQNILEKFELNYAEFRRDVLHKIIGLENWEDEAKILYNCYKLFRRSGDIIKTLERLTLLYEKKCPHDELLAESFDELLKFDEYNIKALKYFKLVFTQQNDWVSVANILKKILHAGKEQEKYRIAHELATVFVYHEANYKEAIDVLNKFCKNSPLETSNLYYEAYYRLGDFESCIMVLGELRKKTSSTREKNLITNRLGHLYLKTGQIKKAVEMFEQVLGVDPHFFEAYEMLVNIAIDQKNWRYLLKTLNLLKARIRSASLREGIETLSVQLEGTLDA